MKRLPAAAAIAVAILLTSCGSQDSEVDPSPTASATGQAPVATDTTAPAYVGGCSAMSVFEQQRVQSGDGSPETAETDFLEIVDKDPSYLAMPASDRELFRAGISAAAAGTC